MVRMAHHIFAFKPKIGALVKYIKDKETICLTNDQARHIYEKVESEGIVNVDTIKQEIEEDKLGSNNLDEDDVNPYYKIITNKMEKEDIITKQMEYGQYSVM